MSDPRIEPALTPLQWAETRESYSGLLGESRHATAALCLADQPFGFTRRDIEALRLALDPAFDVAGSYGAWEDAIRSLVDRIAALLPPG